MPTYGTLFPSLYDTNDRHNTFSFASVPWKKKYIYIYFALLKYTHLCQKYPSTLNTLKIHFNTFIIKKKQYVIRTVEQNWIEQTFLKYNSIGKI